MRLKTLIRFHCSGNKVKDENVFSCLFLNIHNKTKIKKCLLNISFAWCAVFTVQFYILSCVYLCHYKMIQLLTAATRKP